MGVGTRYQLVWTKLLFLFLFLRIHCFICFHFSSTKRIRSFYVDVFEFNTIYVYVFMCTYTYTWGCFDVSGIKVNVQHCARARKFSRNCSASRNARFDWFRCVSMRPMRRFHLPRSSLVRLFRSRRCESVRGKRVSSYRFSDGILGRCAPGGPEVRSVRDFRIVAVSHDCAIIRRTRARRLRTILEKS